jgi:peptidyl-prolyl cis-trans isomerase SurA
MADREEHRRRLVHGWERWSAAALVLVSAACSGSTPPETAPDPAAAEVPEQSQAVGGEPAGQTVVEAEPSAAAGDRATDEPAAQTEQPAAQAEQPETEADAPTQPPAGRPQTLNDILADLATEQAAEETPQQPVGDPVEDAAATEQGPGFALPSGDEGPSLFAPPGEEGPSLFAPAGEDTPTFAPPGAEQQGPTFGAPPSGSAGAAPPRAAAAPTPDSVELVDRVAAIVGDTAILMSEVREQIFQFQAQGMELPTDPARLDSLAFTTLEQMVDEMMIVKQAEFAGITINDDELDAEAQQRFETVRSRFNSDEEMLERVEASGQNMFQFRRMIRSQARKDMLGQRYVATQMGTMTPVLISEDEIRAEFEARAAGTVRPATVSLVRIMIEPKPSEAARDSALDIALTALEEIRAGEDFEVAARRYSDDEGSRSDGGDLGWVRRSEVVPAFGDAAWSVRTGVAVGPIESRFGFHIIKVENVRGGERHVRHILVQPEIEPLQVDEARELAAAVADTIRDGTDPMVMARRYGVDPEDSRLEDARVDRIGTALGPAYTAALSGAEAGDVVGPFEATGSSGKPAFVVIKVMQSRAQGAYELDDVRDNIRNELERRKKFEALVDQLRGEVYIRIMI